MSTLATTTGARSTGPGPWQIAHWWAGRHHGHGSHGPTQPRVDPATGATVGDVPCGRSEEVTAAVGAARRAGLEWAGTDAATRAGLLRQAADRIEARAEELARRQTIEMGKPLPDGAGGVEAAVGTVRQFAELGPLHQGRTLLGGTGALDYSQHVPRGVAAVITPWNDPVAIAAQGLAANLAVGNTVVCKPSERASFSVAALVECFDHLPPGACNLVLGDGDTGAALVAADVDVVVFTGSVPTGRQVASRCAPRLVHPVLELGGNDPVVVDDGIDPAWAAAQLATGGFANAGQICVAAERAIVHRAVFDEVVDALVAAADEIRVGSGLDPETTMGPLVDADHVAHVHEHVCDAVSRGAKVRTGGAPRPGPGCFYPPTVLVDVPDEAIVLHEETFGPVIPVVAANDFDDALDRAAGTRFGLAATVLTPDHEHALRATRQLPVGTVKVNSVFGGAPGGSADPHGLSGTGLGHGPGLLDELTRQRVVHLEAAPRRHA